MKYESTYVEENINVSRKDHGVEFFKLSIILLVLTVAAYLIFGFLAEQIAVRLPLKMEKALGFAFSRQIDETRFPKTRTYAQKVLEKLLIVSKELPPFHYRVDIVDHKEVNAIALPAGRIIVFRGLIEKLEQEEALALVLAHELGHYKYRDHLRGFGRSLVLMAIGSLFGTNGNAPNIVMPSVETLELNFSREHEQAADLFAIETLVRAYGHVGKALDLYSIIEETERKKFKLTLFSTHPDAQQRKASLIKVIKSQGYKQEAEIPFPGDGHLPLLEERQSGITKVKSRK